VNLQRIISWLIARTSGLLPARWRLPLRYYSWAWSKTVEPELTHLFSICNKFHCAVDIGTNHGYYAWKMARRFAQVYAFEANSQVDFDIRHFKKKNVRFFDYGLSDKAGMSMLNVPIAKGIPIIGWASLAKRELPFADAFTQVQVRLERLDDQPFARNGPVDLIKIDVEGHELEVLKGGIETIRRCKPVLIVENNEAQQEEILELLGSMGYRATTLAQLLYIEAESPNLIFLAE
jgi:FkbM family methyltransferase